MIEIDQEGKETILNAGWLRGSFREIDRPASKPWMPFHKFTADKETAIVPGEICEFDVEMLPICNIFTKGSKIGLRISSSDYNKPETLAALSSGHIKRQHPSRITVFHDDEHPSNVLLPVVGGNLLGTYISGGKPYV